MASLSVVVPIYNVEKYLKKCLDSIINQTFVDFELILVDDGSTDSSGKICDSYKRTYEYIKVIHQENKGLSGARNTGIDYASGDYITFIDSDDYIDNKMFEKMMELARRKNYDVVICNRYYVKEDGTKKLRYKKLNNDIELNNISAIYEMNNDNYFDMSAWAKIYKRSLFMDIRFPVGKLSEDFFIMYKIFDKSRKIVYTSIPYYYYLQRKNSISKSAKLNLDFVEAADEQMKYVEIKYPSLKPAMHCAFAAANMTSYNILLLKKTKCNKKDLKILRNNVKNNLKYVYSNKGWSKSRKIQAFLFSNSILIYNAIYKMFKKVRGV